MQIKQSQELKRLLAPQLQQSLKILTLPLSELKNLVSQELEANPILEESRPKDTVIVKIDSQEPPEKPSDPPSTLDAIDGYFYHDSKYVSKDDTTTTDLRATVITKKMNLQEVLLRQLGIFSSSEDDLKIGQEIIGNIDENGYLKATIPEIAQTLNTTSEKVENTLKLIQGFEPNGVAARSISECLLNQLKLAKKKDLLLEKIVVCHLDDVAKKRFQKIAKSLDQPLEAIAPLVEKLSKLDPKPGRNYSLDYAQHIVPDVIIDQDDNDLAITINNEYMPSLRINKIYIRMLKQKNLDKKTREFLTQKLKNALELIRAITRRQSTLRRIVNLIAQIQNEAIKRNLSHLKPLTFQDVARNLNIHETTVCRAIMNKYAKLPYGIVALKDFFPSSIANRNGENVSSTYVKKIIKDCIDAEDRKHPLSDKKIFEILTKDKNLNISRRTVAKYREELKILSSSFRKER
ncbi:MAG: RNA polymerase factor sigma-54 [Candidatus Omnitrophica bacterium]|nr:RNA polymerase factor sigma-54 [Candidatus Omnitrophota bacterium]